jgi:hypothetical protein
MVQVAGFGGTHVGATRLQDCGVTPLQDCGPMPPHDWVT